MFLGPVRLQVFSAHRPLAIAPIPPYHLQEVMDDKIAEVIAFTSTSPERAAQYLQLSDNNVEQAVQLYFDAPNLDLGGTEPVPSGSAQPPPPATASQPIEIDDDEDEAMHIESDDDTSGNFGQNRSRPVPPIPQADSESFEDDEAMARRLQEEMYAGGDMEGPEGVRAPMARTTETLVGPGSNWTEEELNAEVQEQLARRRRPGICG